jgi:hypothetical protein
LKILHIAHKKAVCADWGRRLPTRFYPHFFISGMNMKHICMADARQGNVHHSFNML